METASTEVTSIRRRNNIEKSTRKLIDILPLLKVESTSKFLGRIAVRIAVVDSPFKIDEILTNFPRGISTSNQWRIDEDVPIREGLLKQLSDKNLY